jgi:6-phosphofructokinase 2
MTPSTGSTIVTLTMNPALDINTSANVVRPTDKIRCAATRYDPGGGGINVARVATELGGSATAVFAAGGPTGDLVSRLVRAEGVAIHHVPIAEPTRESFTVNEDSTGKQYRFVLPGPRVTFVERVECLDQLRRAASSASFVVASGSLPPGVPPEFYQRVADICGELGVRLILDTSGSGLIHISSGVFVLKPSVRELRECVGRALITESEQIDAAEELIDRGVTGAVVVSLGSDGALLVTPELSQRFSAFSVPSVSGVGAGDAMVAAITVGLSRGWPLSRSVRYGIAAGTAMLMTPGTAVCRRTDVERLFDLVAEPADVRGSRRVETVSR